MISDAWLGKRSLDYVGFSWELAVSQLPSAYK